MTKEEYIEMAKKRKKQNREALREVLRMQMEKENKELHHLVKYTYREHDENKI